MNEDRPHWSHWRCWCDAFHRDQAVTLALIHPPMCPGKYCGNPLTAMFMPLRDRLLT